jgi:hypothetical protein
MAHLLWLSILVLRLWKKNHVWVNHYLQKCKNVELKAPLMCTLMYNVYARSPKETWNNETMALSMNHFKGIKIWDLTLPFQETSKSHCHSCAIGIWAPCIRWYKWIRCSFEDFQKINSWFKLGKMVVALMTWKLFGYVATIGHL